MCSYRKSSGGALSVFECRGHLVRVHHDPGRVLTEGVLDALDAVAVAALDYSNRLSHDREGPVPTESAGDF